MLWAYLRLNNRAVAVFLWFRGLWLRVERVSEAALGSFRQLFSLNFPLNVAFS